MTGSGRPTLGLVLAGGQGRRMGGADKARLDLAGRPLIAHVLARLGPQVAALAISAGGNPARFTDLGWPMLADAAPGQAGPLGGILAGLVHAQAAGFGLVLTVPVDTPFIPPDLAVRLHGAIGAGAVAVAASQGRRHHAVALWRVAAAGPIAAALARGERRLGAVAAALGCAVVDWGAAAPDPFFNINTPADLAAARASR